eukprot:4206427-Prymnesium_polylepis.1
MVLKKLGVDHETLYLGSESHRSAEQQKLAKKKTFKTGNFVCCPTMYREHTCSHCLEVARSDSASTLSTTEDSESITSAAALQSNIKIRMSRIIQ